MLYPHQSVIVWGGAVSELVQWVFHIRSVFGGNVSLYVAYKGVWKTVVLFEFNDA